MNFAAKALRRAFFATLVASAGVAGAVQQEVVASRLDHPWAVAFLPEGRFLVTERPGRMRIVDADGRVGAPLVGVPTVAARGQGGLLDVVLDSAFAGNRTVYFCYAEPGDGGNSTALARAKLSADATRLDEVKVIFRQLPKVDSSYHFGCRIVEAQDGTLFLTMGERNSRRDDAQRLANHIGKMVRITKDGAVPPDNPFVGRSGAAPEIWSYGHRNMQGATLGPDGRVWTHEHGPQGGDEINVPLPGRNYGWPVITHGEQYGGGKMGEGSAKAGMEQPLHYWVPSIAPSGMAFLTSDRYGADLKGDLFVGSLKFGYVARLELENGKVRRETKWAEIGDRVRDVRQGPDGWLYVLTDEGNGKLIRLKP
ncbi:PQQ-dependent sugar dehydrogenase [Ramlibacter albus]|uniref:PQQ-dependent sugar dehydrogenase n=1 Tax=Ramlibacter albus TaxID=2079448 RepID=A0A923MAK3_9BURK|nr:PQQ-dependent sugar dehydrogenase [Ramlibacter albus]MBC5766711.1 PQQ-dependent sugar dehydrogenase [Ramlibacter albus]